MTLRVPLLPPDVPPLTPHEARVARRLHALRREARREAFEQRHRWRYRVRRGRVEFDREMAALHARLRQSVPAYLWDANPLSLLTAPVIYSLLLPFLLLDAWTTAYQWVCFPIYGIARVRRAPFLALDRHKLQYPERDRAGQLHLLHLCQRRHRLRPRSRGAHRTGTWCPIKHARPVPAPHGHYHHFFDYGDAEGYHRRLSPARRRLPALTASPRAGRQRHR